MKNEIKSVTTSARTDGKKGIRFMQVCNCDFDCPIHHTTNKEIVICAAVKTTKGLVIRGHRHGDAMQTIIRMGLKISRSINSQGFVTSKNRYVTREVGRKLQDAAGIKSADREGYRGTTLFSEDLY